MRFSGIFVLGCLTAVVSALPTSQFVEDYGEAISFKSVATCPDYCAGTSPNISTPQYVCCDFRLGPKRLPTKMPLSDLVDDYDRFGGLCPGPFLAKWYNTTAKSYIYPPQSGFQVDIHGNSIEGTFQLQVGLQLDRFGSEYGTFVSPRAAPYNQRSLPPSNLDTPLDDPRNARDRVYRVHKLTNMTLKDNYHVYQVIKPLAVLSGPIAGWFEQPGQGVQYQLPSNVMDLLSHGYLVRVTL